MQLMLVHLVQGHQGPDTSGKDLSYLKLLFAGRPGDWGSTEIKVNNKGK